MLPVVVQVPPDRTRFPGTESSPDPIVLFAEAMSRALGTPVPVLKQRLVDAPADAFLLSFDLRLPKEVHDGPAEQRLQIAKRTILMQPWRERLEEYLDYYQLAGAVGLSGYSPTADDKGVPSGGTIYVRIDAAERSRIQYVPNSFSPIGYAFAWVGANGRDLPALLAEYLTAYTALGLHHTP